MRKLILGCVRAASFSKISQWDPRSGSGADCIPGRGRGVGVSAEMFPDRDAAAAVVETVAMKSLRFIVVLPFIVCVQGSPLWDESLPNGKSRAFLNELGTRRNIPFHD